MLMVYVILALFLFSFAIFFKRLQAFFFKTAINMEAKRNFKELSSFDLSVLNKMPYIQVLDATEKKKFLNRLLYFYEHIDFRTVEDLKLTEEMKLVFSALCTQITFGFQDYRLEDLKRVFFAPSHFYAKKLNADVEGLTFTNGHMFVSWQGIENGIDDPHSKINLALHELAHILEIESNQSRTSWSLDDWRRIAVRNRTKVRNQDHHDLFRDYGHNNLHECWAVCVEYFFERPIEFKKNFPELFLATKKVLRQDIPERMGV